MRAISILSLLAGISTVSCDAWMALRTRVRKSATGSVIDMRLPAALRHARDVAVVRELAQADPAQAELAEDGARAAAAAAARVLAGLVLGGARLADALGDLGHLGGNLGSLLDVGVALAAEGHAERLEQGVCLGVGRRARGDRDIEAADLIDRVVVDLGEDDLLARGVEDLRVLLGIADAHVQRDLEEARGLHRRRVAEALDERRADLLEVALLEAGVGLRGLSRHRAVLVDRRPGPARHTRARAGLAGDAHAGALLVLGIDEHDVGDVDRGFLLDHAADRLRALRLADLLRALVALDDVQALDVDPLPLGVHPEDRAGLAAVLATDHDHLVVAADLRCMSHARA